MRNTLVLLSSLALAASSHAVESASVTSTADMTYTLGTNMSVAFNPVSVNFPDRAAGLYVYNTQGGPQGETAPQVYEYINATGGYLPVTDTSRYSASLSGGGNGSITGNRFVISSTASGTFSGVDGDQVLFRRYGYRLFLQVTNDAAMDQDIEFNFSLQRRQVSGSTDIPYDVSTNLGQYAESGGVADVVDTSTGDDPLDYDFYQDTIDNGSGTGYSADFTYPAGVPRTFTVPGNGGSIELEVYTSSYVYFNEDHVQGVPEPAAFMPLGIGALAFLRRRRRA